MQDIDKINSNVMYCTKHSKPMPMLLCRVFDGITVGYYCVYCYGFVPINNPEINLMKKLMAKQQ